jgi:50S ribosomal protein L16 3-hydroxylase
MSIGKFGSLLRSISEEKFAREHWPSRMFVSHESFAGLEALSDHPKLRSLRTIAEAWQGSKVVAALPDLDDEYSSVSVSAEDGLKLFRNGMTLIFPGAEDVIPEIKEWLTEIQSVLGIYSRSGSSHKGRSIVYASPDRRGTGPHFDQNSNFVLQLKGTKKWHLSPNRHCAFPLQRYTMKTEPTLDLARYSQLPFPTEMPAERVEVELRPGSFMFVPSGLWHSTCAEGESISLNFTFTPLTWLDVLKDELTRKLSVHEKWRTPAWIPGSSEAPADLSERAEKTWAALLSGLPGEMAGLSGDRPFRGIGGNRYRSNPEVRWVVEGGWLSIRSFAQQELSRVEVPEPISTILDWISRRPGEFSVDEIVEQFGGTPRVIAKFLDTLAVKGALKIC